MDAIARKMNTLRLIVKMRKLIVHTYFSVAVYIPICLCVRGSFGWQWKVDDFGVMYAPDRGAPHIVHFYIRS